MTAELEPLLRFWRAQDALFDRVEPTWWGAVVTDPRYPRLQEPNYARVETRQPVDLAEIESELLPALGRVGCRRAHVVVFFPEDHTDLIVGSSTRGERVTWDLVMDAGVAGTADRDARAQEVAEIDDSFWTAHRDSSRLFDVDDEATLDELQALERDVLIPAGRRWFVVRDAERRGATHPAALGALLVLEGVGYIDHVVTFPEVRRRGHARALTRRMVSEAAAAGAERTYLLAEPDGIAAAMYQAIGFRRVTHLASWIASLG